MKIITLRDVIKGVPARWKAQYPPYHHHNALAQTTLMKLNQLDLETCSKEDIAKIIGNDSWTRLSCSECGEQVEKIIHLGEEPDYEARWFYLCEGCLQRANYLMVTNVKSE